MDHNMQMVKIRIPDQPARAAATLEISKRSRVDCYAGHVQVVPEPALEFLNQLGVAYKELGRGGIDYAEETLRDALAAGAQRRTTRRSRKVRADA
jgi:hypothetical protein